MDDEDSERLLSRLDFELVRLNLQEVQRQTFTESITQKRINMIKKQVVDNWLGLITRMNILLGMIGAFIGGTVGSGKFISELLGEAMLIVLLVLELLFLLFFAIIMASLFLQAMRDNEKEQK